MTKTTPSRRQIERCLRAVVKSRVEGIGCQDAKRRQAIVNYLVKHADLAEIRTHHGTARQAVNAWLTDKRVHDAVMQLALPAGWKCQSDRRSKHVCYVAGRSTWAAPSGHVHSAVMLS